jgi:zinc/manganese transport system substrate-binding protein
MFTRRAALAGLAAGVAASPLRAQVLPPFPVVATFSILADFLRVAGGSRVEIASLVGPDRDVHTYIGGASDARTLAGAKLIVQNGFGLEGWVDQLIGTAAAQAPVVVASRGVKARTRDERASTIDPHAWLSVANAKLYVSNIRDGLRRIDATDTKLFNTNVASYLVNLDTLDAEILAAVETIPAARRLIVTGHDAFGYFGAAYGLRTFSPTGLGAATPGAREIAAAAKQIKGQNALVVFGDGVTDPQVSRQIATEAGATFGGVLYADALTPKGGVAATYLDLMRHNLQVLVAALRA